MFVTPVLRRNLHLDWKLWLRNVSAKNGHAESSKTGVRQLPVITELSNVRRNVMRTWDAIIQQYNNHSEQHTPNVLWEKLGFPPNELYAKGMDINEEVLKRIGQENNKEYFNQGIISSQPFPVEGIIYGDQDRLMVCLACQHARKPNSRIVNVWFLIDTGSKHTYICEEAMHHIGAGCVVDGSVPIVIQDPNKVIDCKFSDLVEFPEINILGMNALLKLNVNIENMNDDTRTFRLAKWR